MFFLIALVAWIGGVVISFYNGNRSLPTFVLLLRLGLLSAPIGIWKLAGIALLAPSSGSPTKPIWEDASQASRHASLDLMPQQ